MKIIADIVILAYAEMVFNCVTDELNLYSKFGAMNSPGNANSCFIPELMI